MNRCVLYLLLLFLALTCTGAWAQVIYQPGAETRHWEFSFSPKANDHWRTSLGFRYRATPHIDLGWQVLLRRFAATDPHYQGTHIAIGALWGFTTVFSRASIGIRLALFPWAAILPSIDKKDSNAPLHIHYGGEASVLIYKAIRLGRALQVFPGLGSISQLIYLEDQTEQAGGALSKESILEWEVGWSWRIPLVLQVGQGKFLTLETSYFHPWHAAAHLSTERWNLALRWSH